MLKDAFYFSHDCNARNDPKILAMIKKYGAQGYGWYWIIVEIMAEQAEHKLQYKQWQMDALAMTMLCDYQNAVTFIEDCIKQYELFESDEEYFWSNSLLRRMKIKEDKRQKRIEAGKKGAENRWKDSDTNQPHSNRIAKDGKGKEKKGKEKENNIYTPEFEKWYAEYPRPQAKKDTFKSFEKVRKEKGLDFILQCTKNYMDYINSLPSEKREFCYSSNNFLGQKAYYLDFMEQKKYVEQKTPVQQALDKMM